MINETSMQSAVIISQVEIDLSKTEDQVIELTEMGTQFFIDKVVMLNPNTSITASGGQIYDNPEKTGKLLFISNDPVSQYDYLHSLLTETNYFCLRIPQDGFPVRNNNHIVNTNKLYFSLHTPQRNAKAQLLVLGYILK